MAQENDDDTTRQIQQPLGRLLVDKGVISDEEYAQLICFSKIPTNYFGNGSTSGSFLLPSARPVHGAR